MTDVGVLLLGGTLLFAALVKAGDLVAFEMAIIRLLPRPVWALGSRRLARSIVAGELLLGVVWLASSGRVRAVTDLVALAAYAVFLALTVRAWLLHVRCGCFRSRRAAEVSDVIRGTLAVAVAGAVAAAGSADPALLRPPALSALPVAAALALATWLALAGVRRVGRGPHPAALSQAAMLSIARGASLAELEALAQDHRVPLSDLVLVAEGHGRGESGG